MHAASPLGWLDSGIEVLRKPGALKATLEGFQVTCPPI
jgi:hypothetical protein